MQHLYLTSIRLIDAIFYANNTPPLSRYKLQARYYAAVFAFFPLSEAWCQPKAMEKIVVRASPLKKEPQLTPNSERVTSHNIERHQSYQVTDSLQHLPGVYVTSFGLSGGVTKVEMRGMPSYNTFVSLDGMPLNDPGVGGAANFSDESARDTKTIQVVNGARALRYDPRAGSGAIIITSKDGSGPRSFFSTLEGGNNKTGFLALGSKAAQDDVQYYTVFSGLRSGSGSSLNQVHGNLLSDYTRQFTGLATLKAKVNPHYNFRLSMRASETTLNMNDSADRNQGQPFPVRSNNVNTIARNLIALNNTIKVPNLPITNEFYVGHTQTRMITQFQGNDYVTDGSTQKVQYTAHFKPDSSIECSLTAAHERELALVPNKGHFSIHMNHLMGNVDIEVTKELTLNLGSRIIKHRLFSPKPSFWTALDYKLTKDIVLFSSFGSGQRFPLIMDLYQTHPEKIGNPNLAPENIMNADVGIVHRWLNNKLSTKLTLFQTYLSNVIVTRSIALDQFQKVNDGNQKAEGFEFELKAAASKQLDITTSYTYISAKESRRQTSPSYIPRHKITLNLDYQLSKKAHVFLGYTHTNERADLDYGIFPPSPVKLSPINSLRLGGSYKISRDLEFYGRIENALNKHYDTIYGYGERDLSVYIGLKSRFG